MTVQLSSMCLTHGNRSSGKNVASPTSERRPIVLIRLPPDDVQTHGGDDHLQPDELQRDIGHGGDDAGDGDRQRQPAIAEAAAHEIGRRDVIVLVADMPKPRENQEQDRVDHDRVRHREEGDGAGAEGERRNGNEGVGRVEVAADQEPGDDGAEAPAAQTPFVQLVEIALAPMRSGETQPCDEAEQHHENAERNPVHILHGNLPSFRLVLIGQSLVAK